MAYCNLMRWITPAHITLPRQGCGSLINMYSRLVVLFMFSSSRAARSTMKSSES